jgi:carbon monoxide dehydrogenase subunit G
MELSSQFRVNADQQAVWEVLTNPALLRSQIQGLERFVETQPGHYEAEVSVGVGFIKSRFSGTMAITDQVELRSFNIAVAGKGRAGTLDSAGKVELEGTGEQETLVRVSGRAATGGMIGMLGDRALRNAAETLMKDFFKKVERTARARSQQAG